LVVVLPTDPVIAITSRPKFFCKTSSQSLASQRFTG